MMERKHLHGITLLGGLAVLEHEWQMTNSRKGGVK